MQDEAKYQKASTPACNQCALQEQIAVVKTTRKNTGKRNEDL